MKVTFVYILTIVATAAISTHQKWSEFKTAYNKSYADPLEEFKRLKIFRKNLAEIQSHNDKYVKGEVTYKKSMNHFGDKTKIDFLVHVIHLDVSKNEISHSLGKRSVFCNTSLPSRIDWRQKGAVTRVKDQGICGSCWSFSALGSLEGQLAINGRGLVPLSVQNLVDCSSDYGNEGCNGGWILSAFAYIHDNGIQSEEDYPYETAEGDCRLDQSKIVANVSDYHELPAGSELHLQQAVAQIGPISVGIDVIAELQFYGVGYFYSNSCSSTNLNHGVLVVGYDSNADGDYWIVKNSWGEDWGDGGYFYLARNRNNNCGIATSASYPELEKEDARM